MIYQLAYFPITRLALIQEEDDPVPEGAVDAGTFEHPDPIYPGSYVPYHKVRDLLYHQDVQNMQSVTIALELPPDPED